MNFNQLTESPFATHRAKLAGNHGAANRLKRLVLNLYNGNRWPITHDELAGYLSNADLEHRAALLEMLAWYAQHGENDPDFILLGRQLALEALGEEDWRTGYDDAVARRDRRLEHAVPNGYVTDYNSGFDAGVEDRNQQ